MKSNELRVGNLVLNKHNEVDIITETSKSLFFNNRRRIKIIK